MRITKKKKQFGKIRLNNDYHQAIVTTSNYMDNQERTQKLKTQKEDNNDNVSYTQPRADLTPQQKNYTAYIKYVYF